LNSLGIDLDKNGTAVKLLYENFILGVKPNPDGTDPWTKEDKSRLIFYVQPFLNCANKHFTFPLLNLPLPDIAKQQE
jgi:hypothetical protein